MENTNNLKGLKIEYHILQNFPVTCLNRDDVGAPKTALIGGVTRARVSSQCWKRAVRTQMKELDGTKLAMRTKHVAELIKDKCLANNKNLDEDRIKKISESIAGVITNDTLHFISENEIEALAEYARELLQSNGDDKKENDVDDKKVKKIHKAHFKPAADGIDIALFGRMVAQAKELNVEAACSFSHAISTHKATNEVDFFTALDDYKPEENTDAGSSHLGALEFNSATYYRYVSLDLGQLMQTLNTQGIDAQQLATAVLDAIERFTKALYVAVPSARQSTMAGNNFWDYAKIYIRTGQKLQASFDEPVRADYQRGGGYLKPSIEALKKWLTDKENASGSMFKKMAEYEFSSASENGKVKSIDTLIEELKNEVKKHVKGT